MPEREAPRPPFFLLFREPKPGALPLAFSAGDVGDAGGGAGSRGAVALFGSEERARAFVASADFGEGWEPVELTTGGLLAVLEDCRGRVGFVALDPPPMGAGGVRVEMGGLEPLISALRQARSEGDLFDLL